MVQIPKFWWLKSSTNIWLSVRNINSIQKVKNVESDDSPFEVHLFDGQSIG